MHVKVSSGNSKMGKICSVSLPSGYTCRKDTPCYKYCYANRLERRRKNVRDSYFNNYNLLNSDPVTYWREVEASVMMSRFFRFHVAGDIPDSEYLRRMVDIANRNQHCDILCFTKKYELVNEYLACGFTIPKNLHLIFSAWRGLRMDNPFHLPEAHVRYRDGTTTAAKTAIECRGNCTECATTEGGCWVLETGQQVVFNEH